jgi:hypothetical protein
MAEHRGDDMTALEGELTEAELRMVTGGEEDAYMLPNDNGDRGGGYPQSKELTIQPGGTLDMHRDYVA